jgi:hypothetical protein
MVRHGMRGLLDYALIHQNDEASPMASGMFPALTDYSDSRKSTRGRRSGKVRHVQVDDRLLQDIRALGVMPVVRDLVDPDRPTWHDREKLAKVFQEVLTACHSRQR